MAGESPDRSKQHESSRPTQGSGTPVPEPHDPEQTPGGVDLATRVLTLPTNPEGAARDTAEADSPDAGESSPATEETSRNEKGAEGARDGDGSGEAGDAGDAGDADGASEAAGNSGDAEGSEDAEETRETGDSAAAGDAGGDQGPVGAQSEDAVPVSGDEGAEGPGAGSERVQEPAGGSGGSGGAQGAQGAPEGAEGGSEREAEDRDADDDGATAGSGGSGERAEDDAEAAPDDAESTPDAETNSDEEPDASGDARDNSAQDADDSDADEAKADSDSDADVDEEARTEADGVIGNSPADEPDASATEDKSPTGDPDSATADSNSPGDKAESDDDAESSTDAESSSDADEPSASTDAPSSPEDTPRSVDQPTAVFKAVRPKPDVDQPTTMLKLGDVKKPGAAEAPGTGKAPDPRIAPGAGKTDGASTTSDAEKPGAAAAATGGKGSGDAPKAAGEKAAVEKAPGTGKTPDAPEKPGAERAGNFVALKPLDDPSTRKPRTSTGVAATAAVPQVGPERTTQQPLPPKPPLDLLAELTNTPPPPPTPLRTLARRVKIWTPLILLLAVVFAIAQSVRPLPTPTLDLTAANSYTFEGAKVDIPWPAKGQAALDVQGVGTFGSSGQEKPVPIASVAKVMTAYLILRDHPLKSGDDGPKIKIDQAAEDQSNAGQESTVNVTAGDSITQREALESILIASANNVARLLARWDAGSETAFVEKMNAAAKDLGMTNTTYTDPSGLNDTTVSTAIDQVKLGKAAMEQPVFREVAAMMSYTDYKGEYHSNWNGLVGKNKVVGIKTGTTTSALGNLMFAAKKEVGGETRTIIGAVVRQPAGGPENTILSAALDGGDKLIRAAQSVLTSATILKKGAVVGYVDDGLGGRTPVVVTKDVTAVGWPGLKVKLSFVAGDLPHTAKAGTQVATLTVGDGGSAGAVKVPVALKSELAEPGFGAKLTRLG
ncbi:D-alanyl-D-alanine carboxypeptidase [Streptomyces roseirectus]|uniref:D-alanyl-D-alanine carboxypeptidase n=1 Tax=Streptomyces roseirectus TaxID=2768066 RepID=UPI001FE3EE4F|nr:D-alanyl-D-alanine carboxypeptidase [Streptomyces roseirectus]